MKTFCCALVLLSLSFYAFCAGDDVGTSVLLAAYGAVCLWSVNKRNDWCMVVAVPICYKLAFATIGNYAHITAEQSTCLFTCHLLAWSVIVLVFVAVIVHLVIFFCV